MSGTHLAGITSVTLPGGAEHGPQAAGDANGTDLDAPESRPVRRQLYPHQSGLPSNVIHELRTPLTSIHGYAQVLQRSLRDNPRANNAIGVVVRESTRLSSMLAALSELAELQSGELVCTPVPVETDQIVEGVVIEARRHDGGAHPIQVEGDGLARCSPTMLSQAVTHVLTNAIRYSPEGAPISVTIARAGEAVEIVIADRGIGIRPEEAERIYEPFERGANARLEGVRGLGLGLFLARESLMAMRGWIEHREREGGGTTFRLTVPAV